MGREEEVVRIALAGRDDGPVIKKWIEPREPAAQALLTGSLLQGLLDAVRYLAQEVDKLESQVRKSV